MKPNSDYYLHHIKLDCMIFRHCLRGKFTLAYAEIGIQELKDAISMIMFFFLSIDAKVNIKNLKAKLVQSKFISADYDLTIDNLKTLLNERFEHIDFAQAKEDVLPFVKDKPKLDLWSKEFFKEITKNLKAI